MKHLVVSVVAFLMSGLTLLSGFGLGTVLTPTFALFFPVPVAVAATALVHLANNGFKLFLLGRYADWRIVVRFGVPAAIAAFAGASLLSLVARLPALIAYDLGG
ncbi:MAG TPA: TSUP family transporter, partial [Methylomirabilota bacterium]|nr:TSUP family transporter [Methylomirabilota bacterium]